MEENKSEEIEFIPVEVICGDCTGNQHQVQVDRKTLFGVKYYVRWKFHCDKCGKESKEHISKI